MTGQPLDRYRADSVSQTPNIIINGVVIMVMVMISLITMRWG